jgi:hypothetical protein
LPHNMYERANFWVLFGTLIAAAFAAGFTGYTAWLAKDTATRQLRAYVTVKNVQLKCPECKSLHDKTSARFAVLHLQNGGQTPAYQLRTEAGAAAWSNNGSKKPMLLEIIGGQYSLAKDQSIEVGQEVNLSEVEQATTGENPPGFVIYGQVDYFDIYQRPRRTPFCFVHTGRYFVNCWEKRSSVPTSSYAAPN